MIRCCSSTSALLRQSSSRRRCQHSVLHYQQRFLTTFDNNNDDSVLFHPRHGLLRADGTPINEGNNNNHSSSSSDNNNDNASSSSSSLIEQKDDEQQYRRYNYYCCCCCWFGRRLVLLLLIVILIAVGTTVAVILKSQSQHQEEDDSKTTTRRIHEQLRDILIRFNTSSVEELKNKSTAQYRALEWLALEDSYYQRNNQTLEEAMMANPLDIRQRYLGALIYTSLGGPYWLNEYQFMSTEEHVCDWNQVVNDKSSSRSTIFGIACSGEADDDDDSSTHSSILQQRRQIDYIHLPNNNLMGQLPDELFSRIPALTHLSLEYNSIRGTIPYSYSYNTINWLQQLEYLNLQYNSQLTGSIPAWLFTNNDLPQLKLLWLDDCTGLTGSLPDSAAAASNNNNNKMTSLSLQNLPGLYGTIPSSLLRGMTKLRGFYLSNTDISGTLPNLDNNGGSMTSLEHLVVTENPGLTGTIPSCYFTNSMPRLERLDLYSNSLDGSLPKLHGESLLPSWRENLKYLYLDDNFLEGDLELFFSFSSSWSGDDSTNNNNGTSTDITAEEDADAAVVVMKEMALQDNFFTGLGHDDDAALGAYQHLETLSMYNNPLLKGTLPTQLGLLSNSLEVLDISRTSVQGQIPSELGSLTALRILDLNTNELTGTIPSTFGHLTKLQQLSVANNNLTGIVPTELAALPDLQLLLIQFNAFDDTTSLESYFCPANNAIIETFRTDCYIDDIHCTCCSECCYYNSSDDTQNCIPQQEDDDYYYSKDA
mmetsp:Transcript_11729/g.18064  ORF Transcript_11729/g.18064 Transcript_11729/m.18064 type:complete len:763 (+) Transcript_11729:58-2346(+)